MQISTSKELDKKRDIINLKTPICYFLILIITNILRHFEENNSETHTDFRKKNHEMERNVHFNDKNRFWAQVEQNIV